MKRLLGLMMVCLVLINGGSLSADRPENGFKLPPVVKAARSYPRLVNYFHMIYLTENNVSNREEYLAQWDVLILYPEAVTKQGLSLRKIRQVNPTIKILAWIPFGQSSEEFAMSQALPNLTDYYIRDAHGRSVSPPWGGHLMNPWKNNYGWPKHVISYIEQYYLKNGAYDGVMFDCLWGTVPNWYAPVGADIDENRQSDRNDNDCYLKGMTYLIDQLRSDQPASIVTGNGAWPADSPYFKNANGDMMENAFGNEFGVNWGTFSFQWDNYTRCMEKITMRPMYYLLIADLRNNRSLQQASEATGMTENDRRRFRLALTTTLLGDGYFGFDRVDCLHGQLWWFNEYNVDLGNPATGFEAPHSYRTDVYGKGSYSREFNNGSVIVNPTYRKMPINFPEERTDASTGITAKSFKLPSNDGGIYMKTGLNGNR